MKVTNNKIGANPAQVETAKSAKSDAAKKTSGSDALSGALAGKASSAGKINVSERAQMMQKAKEIASEQTVNESRVAELQKLIDQGKYRVDADKIADRLVDEHLAIPD